MSIPLSAAELAARVLDGRTAAVSRAITWAESNDRRFPELLSLLHPRGGRARVIGLTGSPGAGKSTLTAALARLARAEGKRVGIVAVDPSSPFSGGAILGDRIRMQDHATDPGVFIRSLGTRGHLGGLSRSTADLVAVMDAMGKDVILVETVGVGQDEIEIASLAHTVVVVAVPGMGDDVQAIKAGVMEIADLFAVNKADREGSERTVRDLQGMLELRRIVQPAGHDLEHRTTSAGGAYAQATWSSWEPPIVRTVAVTGEGVAELAAAIERHGAHLAQSGERLRRDVSRARATFVAILRERLLAGALARLELELGRLDDVAERIAARQADPYQLADELAARVRGAP